MFSMKQLAAVFSVAAFAIQPTLAQAQDATTCVTEKEVSDTAIYAVPGLIVAMKARCGPSLSSKGFLARDGEKLSARYRAFQDTTWPRAKSTFFKFAASSASGNKQYVELIAGLPDKTVRPLLDVMMADVIAQDFVGKNCGKAERVLQALAPIEPNVAGELLAVIMSLSETDKLSICPVEPA